MGLEPLADKWKAFGWAVFECDGNDHGELIYTIEKAQEVQEKPSVIICHTIMGKGVKSIENDFHWHGKAPSKEEAERFIAEIDKMYP